MSLTPNRVLAISFRMPPLLSPRAVQVHRLLTHWALRGIDITVICADPRTVPQLKWDQDLVNIYPQNIHHKRIIFPKQTKSWFNGAIGIQNCVPDPFRPWIKYAKKAALNLLKQQNFDLMLTFANPMTDHLIGLSLKRQVPIPWIAHFSDPWVDNPYLNETKNFLARYVNANQEKRVVKCADQVVFVSEETRELVMQKYPSHWWGKSFVIPHYFDPDIYPNQPEQNSTLTFRYVGSFYQFRTPEPLFRALKLLKDRQAHLLQNVQFEMIGPCAPSSLAKRLCRSYQVEPHVKIRPEIPYLESLESMMGCDVLLLIDASTESHNVFLPSKLVDYLGTKRPLLGLTPLNGPSADFIRQSGGLVADPEDTAQVASVIETYIKEYRRGVLEEKRTPGEGMLANYDVKQVAPYFFEQLTKRMIP